MAESRVVTSETRVRFPVSPQILEDIMSYFEDEVREINTDWIPGLLVALVVCGIVILAIFNSTREEASTAEYNRAADYLEQFPELQGLVDEKMEDDILTSYEFHTIRKKRQELYKKAVRKRL